MASKSKSTKPAAYLQRGMSDIISYEDVLVAQYMEEIQRQPPVLKGREVKASPYTVTLKSDRRTSKIPKSPTKSAIASPQRTSRDLSDIPNWFELLPVPTVAPTGETGEEVIEVRRQRKSRPKSAPATRQRLGSFSSSASYSVASSTVSSARRTKPLYKKKPKVLCVRAFQNGNRDNYARVAAPNLHQLLDACTIKLGLISAARKLYLESGSLVYHANQLEKDVDVYVSCGEAFRDPYAAIRDREDLRRTASWGLSGIVLPEDKARGKTKPSLSKRMESLVESQRRRILVFRNGDSAEGVEIVAGRFDEFLDDCTKKLNLESGARLLYDWEGKEIYTFSEVPVLDRILQPSTTVVLGPVWVTRGAERFSPKGALNFFSTLLLNTRDRIKESKAYKEQLRLHINDQEVLSKEIMSMKKEEAEKELKEVEEHISELSVVMPAMKSNMEKLRDTAEEEQISGLETYKYQHLSEIAPESRLLGKQGLRVKVYENGRSDGDVVVYFNLREAEKGIQDDKEQLLHRFLDTCTSCQRVSSAGTGPAGRRVARRIFLGDGSEVKSVQELKYDDNIWLSYGEEFKPLHVMSLQLTFDKATCISLWDEKEVVHRESMADEEKGKEKASLWRAVKRFPSGTKRQLVKHDMQPAQKLNYALDLQPARVNENSCFLQFKENRNLVLYPELKVEKKAKKGHGDMWPPDAQEWIIAQSGAIHSRAMPQLVLSRSEEQVNVFFSGEEYRGFAVSMAKRDLNDPNQQWGFSPTGHIYCTAKPNVVLTCVADCRVEPEISPRAVDTNPARPEGSKGRTGDSLGDLHFLDDKLSEPGQKESAERKKLEPSLADLKDVYAGQTFVIALLERFPGKHPAVGAQRWAIKQEDLSNIGQWKFSTVANPEWNKRALSWPVTEDGNWNDDFTWPMEGFLLPYSPPIKKPTEKKTTPAGPPARLKVLKNGEAEQSRAVIVVGPDLTNMLHDVRGHSPSSKKPKRRSRAHDHSNEERCEEESESCHPLDLKKLEFDLFLDRCTDALSLPFAARRMFTEDGKELHSVTELGRDQLVYVSCGDAWSDPKLSYSEQQRRAILANLASDIAHIRRFCALRDPQDLVLQVDGPVAVSSRICVALCAISSLERENLVNNKEIQDAETADPDENMQDSHSHVLTAHERAHQRSDERLKTLRWSWENDHTSKGDLSIDERCEGDFDDEVMFTDRGLQRKFKQQTVRTQHTKPADPCKRQKWCYTSEGFIHIKGTSLALALENSCIEGKSSGEVVLCKKKLEDPTQRWVIAEDGTICLRSNPQLVLTIATPPLGNDPFSTEANPDGGFVGSAVNVAHRKACANGNAHQLWRYDSMTGFIEAFAANTANREITAANKSNVCTYALLGLRKIQQPGYVFMPNTSKESYLCEACGKAARGRHKLQRLQKLKAFTCALGKDSGSGLKMTGSFKCLNSKVDLSTLEADATLDLWEHQLARLRSEGSVRIITRELRMAQSVPAVRIRAFKNGEGSLGEGQVVIGSSIRSLLDQCTVRLGVASAARRMYTIRGELITDIHQIIRPYRDSLVEEQEGEPEELVEDVHTKLKITDEHNISSNGHAVDFVAAENRRHYKSPQDTKLDLSGLFRADHTGAHEQGRKDEDEEEAKEEEMGSEHGNGTYRVSEERNRSVPVIIRSSAQELPRWDARWPIDVWVSCGEPFVPLKEAETQYLLSIKHREERMWVQAYLEQEKHVLRQLQGRRIGCRSPPQSPRACVALTPAWTEPTRTEEKKEETISELKNHLKEVKSKQKAGEPTLTKSAKASTQRLYSTPKTVRVKVYPNGETREREVVVFGSSIEEILDSATSRLGLSSAGRRLFTTEGDEVSNISSIKRDQVLCASCGEGFVRARDRRHQMELKATWSRMTRQSGGALLPGSGPVTRNSINFNNTMLALPAPASPPPPPRTPSSPYSQQLIHSVHGSKATGWR